MHGWPAERSTWVLRSVEGGFRGVSSRKITPDSALLHPGYSGRRSQSVGIARRGFCIVCRDS